MNHLRPLLCLVSLFLAVLLLAGPAHANNDELPQVRVSHPKPSTIFCLM